MRLRPLHLVLPCFVPALLVAACVGDDPAVTATPATDGGGSTEASSTTADGAAPGTDGAPREADAADAAPPDPAWTVALTSKTTLTAVVVEPLTGDVYVGGSLAGTAPEVNLTSVGGSDALLMKIQGSTGKILWTKIYGGPGDDAIAALALSAGSLFVTGTTTSSTIAFAGASPGATLTFPSTTQTAPIATQSFIANVSASDGSAKWAVTPDAGETAATKHASLCAAVVVVSGLPHVLCTYTGTTFGGASVAEPTATGSYGATVLKLSSLGSIFAPVRSLGVTGTTASVFGSGFTTDATAVYVSGLSTNNLVDENTNVTLLASPGGFVARIPLDGSAPTAKALSSGGGSSLVATALRLGGGGLLLTGKFSGSPAVGGLPAITAQGSSDGFLVSMTADLVSFQSAFRFGGNGEEDANALAVAADGHVWLGGRYFSTDFQFGTTALPVGAPSGFQGFVGALTDSKTPTSATAFVSSSGNVNVAGVDLDQTAKFVVSAGSYGGLATFGPNAKSTSMSDTAGFVVRRPY